MRKGQKHTEEAKEKIKLKRDPDKLGTLDYRGVLVLGVRKILRRMYGDIDAFFDFKINCDYKKKTLTIKFIRKSLDEVIERNSK